MTKTEMSDEALLHRAANGDDHAFGILAKRYFPRLVSSARRVLGRPGDAEDVAQEALARAWRHAGRYDPSLAKVTTWLNRIALNLAFDRIRATRSSRIADIGSLENYADDTLSAFDVIAREQHMTSLAAGIAALPERQRKALILSYAEERPGVEAASILGISTRALEGLLRRGRLFLRAWLVAHEA